MSRPLPQITRLLTLGVTSIVALNFVALLVAYGGYSAFRTQQSEFNNNTLPLARLARTVATSANDLLNLSNEVTSRSDTGELDTLESQIVAQVETIRRGLEGVPAIDEHNRPNGAGNVSMPTLSLEVDAAISALVESVPKQRSILLQSRELSTVIEGVRENIADLRLKLTTFAAGSSTDTDERDLWRELMGAIGPWEARYLLLKDGPSAESVDDLLVELQAEVRTASLSVSRLPDSRSRQEVAGLLLPVLLSCSDADGPFSRTKRLANDRDALNEILLQTRGELAQFRDRLNLVSIDMRGEISESISGLSVTTRNMERLLAGLCLVSLIGGIWFVRRFVMRGLGQPLTQLAEKTHQLAQGDFDIEPPNAKVLEFDLIEQALTVFAGDSSQLRLARDELAVKNLSLKQSLEDLERFSYAASHDLRSPLRGIDTLATFIRQDLGADVPEEVAHNLDRMRRRIESLELLLEDLLAYSRAGRVDPVFTEVDIAEQVGAALELLDVRERVGVTYGLEVETLNAPEALIYQVIRNIIDNAIKHHPRAALKAQSDGGLRPINLHIVSTRRGQNTLVEIADDGDGVPDRYLNRVLGLFETLERKSHANGSGLGLPLIRKLLRQFGGDVELGNRSDDHSGLAVTIRWPDAAKRHADSLVSTR